MSAEQHFRRRRPRHRLPRPAAVVGALTGLSLALTSCGTNPFVEEQRVQATETAHQSETAPQGESAPQARASTAAETPETRAEAQTPLTHEVSQQVGIQHETIARAGQTLQQMQSRSEQPPEQDTAQEDTAQHAGQDSAQQDSAQHDSTDQRPTDQDRAEADQDTRENAEESTAEQADQGTRENAEEPMGPPADATYPADLNQALEQIAEHHPGEYSISVAELTGQGRVGAYESTEPRTSASTYKLFVAYSVMLRTESGEMSWDDEIEGGRDLDQCFDDMLALSDNPCPEEIADEIGWESIYADAAGVGTVSSGHNDEGLYTTAADLTTFLAALQSGSLSISPEGHQRILDSLAGNIHRQGVPSGSIGTVIDKPGFLDENLHDAAIVHHPQGTYVLTVMSQDASWEALASVSHEVETLLYG
ncbi:serine hydrolase [Nesterenkonia lacusekhoensis]|uniref:Beta-lactamase class A n=1 Tax=Nesterenkonia lacusekhoensis TaxID=150832 RepID=A0ABS4T1A5_9MICC|nr:serine hydrolase [Nesterenkonia lacusekhoensis]MBP2317799.1 beta-lactamase class A [Nesterenkonia lacusekhoensis]